MTADYDQFLEQQRALRYDGGDEDEQDEQGERADDVARLYSEGHERRAQMEMDAEDDERCLKSYKEAT